MFTPNREKLWAQHSNKPPTHPTTVPVAPLLKTEVELKTGWTWELLPLNHNVKWLKARRAKLWEVTEAMDNKAKLCNNGIRNLRHHLDTLQGKCATLNLLWWDGPLSQWFDLFEGISGNFITYPPP
eukprot:72421-Ditylum_brightwellii.AAC.1